MNPFLEANPVPVWSPTPVLACVQCKKAHLKCGRQQPVCLRCLKLGTPCTYPERQVVKRGEGKKKKDKKDKEKKKRRRSRPPSVDEDSSRDDDSNTNKRRRELGSSQDMDLGTDSLSSSALLKARKKNRRKPLSNSSEEDLRNLGQIERLEMIIDVFADQVSNLTKAVQEQRGQMTALLQTLHLGGAAASASTSLAVSSVGQGSEPSTNGRSASDATSNLQGINLNNSNFGHLSSRLTGIPRAPLLATAHNSVMAPTGQGSNVIGKGAHRAAHEPVLLEGEMELVSKISAMTTASVLGRFAPPAADGTRGLKIIAFNVPFYESFSEWSPLLGRPLGDLTTDETVHTVRQCIALTPTPVPVDEGVNCVIPPVQRQFIVTFLPRPGGNPTVFCVNCTLYFLQGSRVSHLLHVLIPIPAPGKLCLPLVGYSSSVDSLREQPRSPGTDSQKGLEDEGHAAAATCLLSAMASEELNLNDRSMPWSPMQLLSNLCKCSIFGRPNLDVDQQVIADLDKNEMVELPPNWP